MSLDIEKLLSIAQTTQSKWELDNIVWHDRTSNPSVLLAFLKRLDDLKNTKTLTPALVSELAILEELANEMDQAECEELLSSNDETVRQRYIEDIARQSALETLCNDAISIATMERLCKLSPNDFILASKRGQDIINAIRELVIQGETLSDEVAGA